MNTSIEKELNNTDAPKLTPTQHAQLDEYLQGGMPVGVTLLLAPPDPKHLERMHPLVSDWLQSAGCDHTSYETYKDESSFQDLCVRAMREDTGVLCVMVTRTGNESPMLLSPSQRPVQQSSVVVCVSPLCRGRVSVKMLKHKTMHIVPPNEYASGGYE